MINKGNYNSNDSKIKNFDDILRKNSNLNDKNLKDVQNNILTKKLNYLKLQGTKSDKSSEHKNSAIKLEYT